MLKRCSELTPEDFVLENPEWEYDSPVANVEYLGREVPLGISDRDGDVEAELAIFQEALPIWEARLPELAKQVEEYLQHFLPGRKINPDEIVPFLVFIYRDDEPNAVNFLARVTGDYNFPQDQLDEFDHQSALEFQYGIKDGKIDWDDLTLFATNDFDH